MPFDANNILTPLYPLPLPAHIISYPLFRYLSLIYISGRPFPHLPHHICFAFTYPIYYPQCLKFNSWFGGATVSEPLNLTATL